MTHPIHSADAELDLDRLEALAKAATPGDWTAKPQGRLIGGPMRHYVNGSAQAQIASFSVTFHDQAPNDEPERQQANTDFSAGFSPATALRLVAMARAAAQVGANGAADILPWQARRADWLKRHKDKREGPPSNDPFTTAEIADLRARLAAGAPAETPKHPDDIAVDTFAAAMKAKMAKQREKGYGGWDDQNQCSDEFLAYELMEHTKKGDPVDVANFCMMLHQRYNGDTFIVADVLRIAALDFARRVASMFVAPAATIGAGEGKDAARVQFLIDHPHWSVRWRIQTKKQIQQWQMVDDGEPWGQWGEYRAVVDAARAAMRSKTSPGEAG